MQFSRPVYPNIKDLPSIFSRSLEIYTYCIGLGSLSKLLAPGGGQEGACWLVGVKHGTRYITDKFQRRAAGVPLSSVTGVLILRHGVYIICIHGPKHYSPTCKPVEIYRIITWTSPGIA